MTNAVALAQMGGISPSWRNRIINGDMTISQRNGTSSVTPDGSYTLDRWQFINTQTGKVTAQQNAGSVATPIGFSNYLGLTSTSAYSVGSGDTFFISQKIEGFNFSDLNWGTANAATVTLSFWVRSSITGTFGGSITNSAANRSYPFSYTISAANTWEQKSVTIAGDTTGTWIGSTNGIGAQVNFNLGSGSTYSGTANSWQAGGLYAPTGATSVVGTNGATFYITGVQLEKGSVATSFDYLPYGTELALCQRYYVDLANNGGSTQNTFRAIGFGSTYNTTAGTYVVQVPVPMRVVPSLTQAGTMYLQNLGSTSISSFAGPYSIAGTIVEGDFNMVAPVAANAPGILRWNNSSTQRFAYSAEL